MPDANDAVAMVLTFTAGAIYIVSLLRLRRGADHLELDETARGALWAVPLLSVYFVVRTLQPVLPDMGAGIFIFRNIFFLAGTAVLFQGLRTLLTDEGQRTAAVVLAASVAAASLPVFTAHVLVGFAVTLSTAGMGLVAGALATLGWHLKSRDDTPSLMAALAFAAAGVLAVGAWMDSLLVLAGLNGDFAAFTLSRAVTDLSLVLSALLVRPGIRTLEARWMVEARRAEDAEEEGATTSGVDDPPVRPEDGPAPPEDAAAGG